MDKIVGAFQNENQPPSLGRPFREVIELLKALAALYDIKDGPRSRNLAVANIHYPSPELDTAINALENRIRQLDTRLMIHMEQNFAGRSRAMLCRLVASGREKNPMTGPSQKL